MLGTHEDVHVLVQVIPQHQLVGHCEPVGLHRVILAEIKRRKLACSQQSICLIKVSNSPASCQPRKLSDALAHCSAEATEAADCYPSSLHHATAGQAMSEPLKTASTRCIETRPRVCAQHVPPICFLLLSAEED